MDTPPPDSRPPATKGPPYRKGQPVMWYHTNPALSNRNCVYCGVLVGEGAEVPSNKEHLIARRLVPTGSLGNDSFNFIFRSCKECNDRKAVAERHVSTVTLYTSPARRSDPKLDAEAQHKAASDFTRRRPGERARLVQDATDDHEFRYAMGGTAFNVTFVSPPQLNLEHAYTLAAMQVQALFTFVTTFAPGAEGGMCILPLGNIQVLGCYPAADWGNAQLIEAARRAAPWTLRFRTVAAEGNYCALLRRSDDSGAGWFWALEWNRSVRVVGAITLPNIPSPLFADLPQLDWRPAPNLRRIREEAAVQPDDDVLFAWDEQASGDTNDL